MPPVDCTAVTEPALPECAACDENELGCDVCAAAQCGAHGTCTARFLGGDLPASRLACLCHPPYTGPRCTEDPCASRGETCNGRGTCVGVADSSTRCECDHGYSGPSCELDCSSVCPGSWPFGCNAAVDKPFHFCGSGGGCQYADTLAQGSAGWCAYKVGDSCAQVACAAPSDCALAGPCTDGTCAAATPLPDGTYCNSVDGGVCVGGWCTPNRTACLPPEPAPPPLPALLPPPPAPPLAPGGGGGEGASAALAIGVGAGAGGAVAAALAAFVLVRYTHRRRRRVYAHHPRGKANIGPGMQCSSAAAPYGEASSSTQQSGLTDGPGPATVSGTARTPHHAQDQRTSWFSRTSAAEPAPRRSFAWPWLSSAARASGRASARKSRTPERAVQVVDGPPQDAGLDGSNGSRASSSDLHDAELDGPWWDVLTQWWSALTQPSERRSTTRLSNSSRGRSVRQTL